ncbi:hypothetical protein AGOR_G00082090 [Albula goreensis]|uniref:Ig-like domain-containing protein n=1 Tax=Albula goreensis TaxID=1534307 RepID=A0A8T3DII5_9TELE|nr:hypothetical protein AGOR_G00082090 [Albula goreensis]
MLYLTLLSLLSAILCVQSSTDIVQPERNVLGSFEDAVTVPCFVDGMGSFTMSWYRQRRWGHVLEYILDETGQVYGRGFDNRFTVTYSPDTNQFSLHISRLQQSDSAEYYCATGHCATQQRGDCSKTLCLHCTPALHPTPHALPQLYPHCHWCSHFGSVGTKLDVLDPQAPVTPPQVWVLPPAPQEVRRSRRSRSKVTLVCVATGFYPDHIHVLWRVNGEEVEGAGADSAPLWDESKRTYSLSSRLRIPAHDWLHPKNNFTCVTSFYDGSHNLINNHTIYGEEGCLSAAEQRMGLIAARFSYTLLICKTILYMLVLGALLWKLKGPDSST